MTFEVKLEMVKCMATVEMLIGISFSFSSGKFCREVYNLNVLHKSVKF